MRLRSGSSLTGAKSIGQKLFLSVFFGIFALVGAGTLIAMGAAVLGTIARFSWTATPCVVDSSALNAESGVETGAAGWQVRYRYTVAGQEYFSTTITEGWMTRDTGDDRRLSQRYAPGTEAVCYVNPRDPTQAVLFRGSMSSVWWVLFPLPFVAVGFGGLYFVWRRTRSAPDGSAFTPPLTRAAPGASANRRWVAVLFFSLLLLIGAIGTWALGVKPVLRVLVARDWPAVPCTIIAGHVETHDSDDGYTYSVALVYRYEIDGRSYTSDHYRFVGGSSSGRAAKQAIVDRYPRGSTATCYVNPNDPTDAVIERGVTATMAFGFIPLVFLLVGLGGIVGVFGHWSRSGARTGPTGGMPRETQRSFRRPAIVPTAVDMLPVGAAGGPVVLETRGSRTGKFVGLLVFALVWNGIVSVFVVSMVHDWTHGGGAWFMALFLVPFVGIGLTVFGLAIHAGLAIFNPRSRLFVSSAALAPGDTLELRWEMQGSAQRLRRFRIELEGREEATYRRGTDTKTDKHVFARVALADVRDPAGIAAGSAQARLPADAMHSFVAKHNKIMWTLHVRGDIPRWPDIDDEFPFTVLAHIRGEASSA